MTKFNRLMMSVAAAATCVLSAGAANAAILIPTYTLQTYPTPGHSYTVTFDYSVLKPAFLTFTDYFGPINADDMDATATVLVSGTGTYSPGITFGKKVSLTYVLVPEAPEPTTWAMMLAGFGAMGFGLRNAARRKPRHADLSA